MTAEEQAAWRTQRESAWVDFLGPRLDEPPACWSWPIPDDLEQRATADLAQLDPKTVVRLGDLDDDYIAGVKLRLWQAGRCAICCSGGSHVLDHDHQTGLVRGYLCQSCNIREGQYRGDYGVFIDYRSRPPATLLGITVRYLDPFTGDFAEPAPAPAYDKRRDNPMRGVGL